MNEIARETLLAEVRPLLPNAQPLVVEADLPLRSAAVMASERQEIDTFAVVDDRQILVGILTVDALVNDVLADLFPEGFLPDVTGLRSLISSAGLFVKHRSVGEIMDEPYSVTDNDHMGAAIQKMRVKKLRGIPVVDADGKVTAYLDLFDTLVAWMRSDPNNGGEEV